MPRAPSLPRGVVALGLVSLFMDVSPEMVHALLPLAERLHWSNSALTAGLVPVVIGGVWLMVRRIRKSMH